MKFRPDYCNVEAGRKVLLGEAERGMHDYNHSSTAGRLSHCFIGIRYVWIKTDEIEKK